MSTDSAITTTSQPESGRAAPWRLPRELSVKVYLPLFVLVILLPSLIFSGFLLLQSADRERKARENDVTDVAQSIGADVDREIANMITTLRILSTSQPLKQENLDEFHKRSTTALGGTGYYVLLLNQDLQQLVNTRVPYGTPLGKTSDPASAKAALAQNAPYVSDVFFGGVAREPVFNVTMPVTVAGNDQYVLILTRDAENLVSLLNARSVNKDWVVSLLDRDSDVIARSKDTNAFVGRKAAFGDGGSDGSFQVVKRVNGDGDKEPRLAFRWPTLAGWTVAITVPQSTFEAPLVYSQRLLLLGGGSLLGLSVLLSIILGKFISRPIRQLRHNALQLGEGKPIENIDSALREVNEVSTALITAAQERQSRDEHIRLLMREVAHRAKNQLAVIQAMASRTADSSATVDEYQSRFLQRIHGLSKSMDLLSKGSWDGAPLGELAKAQLEAFHHADSGRVSYEGPDVRVGPQAAQSLGLALHELATNASKYGALSSDDGRVDIRWQVTGKADKAFAMSWTERDGPAVKEPTREGFGRIVFERLVAQSLDAKVDSVFDPQGLRWDLTCPLENLKQGL